MSSTLRPLTLGELLDGTVSLYRRYFVLFTAIVALPSLPVLALNLLRVIYLPQAVGGTPEQVMVGALKSLAVTLVLVVPSLLAHALSTGATVIAVSRLHLDQPVTIGSAFSAIKGRVFAIAGITMVVTLFMSLGFLFFLIPGVILMLRWALVIPAAVLESLGVWRAMDRSATLCEGDYGRVFGVYALYFIAGLAIAGLIQSVLYMSGVTPGASGAAATSIPVWSGVVIAVGSWVASAIVGPLLTIVVSLLYYDERVRKEAFDVRHLLAQLDAAAPIGEPVG